jgi:uncharacterized protein YndB with AHSA1/START domain
MFHLLWLIPAALAALLLYAATRPNTFRLERSTHIKAQPAQVLGLIEDMHHFNRWNPFAQIDPTQTIGYEDITVGVGAAYSWLGKKSGAGRMEVIEVVPGQRVSMRLDFTRPFVAHNRVDFTATAASEGCQITWAMSGDMAYINKLMSVFASMDKMVGGEFEKGLANLKALAEKA